MISTMPPNVLEPIAIAPLTLTNDNKPDGTNTTNKLISDWGKGCRVQQMTTAEGNTMFYYTIKKLANTKIRSTFGSQSKRKSEQTGKEKIKDSNKEDIMAGINALLEEAKKAAEDMKIATNKVSCE